MERSNIRNASADKNGTIIFALPIQEPAKITFPQKFTLICNRHFAFGTFQFVKGMLDVEWDQNPHDRDEA